MKEGFCMFDEIKYTHGSCNYFAIGIAEEWSDSRIIWWETERLLNKRVEPVACLEHCAVEVSTGIYLDAMGIFFSADDREDAFEDLSTSAHGTLQDFKGYLRKIKCTYGDYREKAAVVKLLQKYHPIVTLKTHTGTQTFMLYTWSCYNNMLYLHPVRPLGSCTSEENTYIVCGNCINIATNVFKQHFVSSLGWKEILDVNSKNK